MYTGLNPFNNPLYDWSPKSILWEISPFLAILPLYLSEGAQTRSTLYVHLTFIHSECDPDRLPGYF